MGLDRITKRRQRARERVPVKFLRGMLPYNTGEVAGFTPARSAQLIKAGIAEAYELTEDDKARLEKKYGKWDEEAKAAGDVSTEPPKKDDKPKGGKSKPK